MLFLGCKVKSIICSGGRSNKSLLVGEEKLKKERGTLTVTSSACLSRLIHGFRMTGVTYLTRSLAQKSLCRYFVVAEADIEVVFAVTEKRCNAQTKWAVSYYSS